MIQPLLRSLILPVYLPTVFLTATSSAVIPLAPTLAIQVGSSLSLAVLVAGFIVIGQLAGNIPGGWAAGKFSEKKVMAFGALISALSTTGTLIANNAISLAIALFFLGFSVSFFAVARLAYATIHIPVESRGRALSLVGGSMRVGAFLGPLAGWLAGTIHLSILVAIMFATFGLILQGNVFRVENTKNVTPPNKSNKMSVQGLPGSFFRIAVTAALITTVRTSRILLVPLWALSLGFDAGQTSLLVAAASMLDLAFFYLGGVISDKKGVLYAGVPSVVLMSTGIFLLALNLPVEFFIPVVLVMGISNGLGSGFLDTVASRVVPINNRGSSLGVFRVISDTGAALTPFSIAGLTAVIALTGASLVLSFVGILGITLLAILLPNADTHK